MTDVLRDEVLKDTGHSRLKGTVLDLISKLRVEAKVISTHKEALRDKIKKKKSTIDKDSEVSEEDLDDSDSSEEAPIVE